MRMDFLGIILLSIACRSDKVVSYTSTPAAVTIQEPSDGSNFYIGETIRFKALLESGADASEEFSHQWTTGNQTVCEPEAFDENGFGFCEWSYESIGNFSMMVSVSGPRGGAQSSVELEILENEAPVILITSPEMNERFASDDMIVFNAEVDDTEESSELLTVTGRSNIDGDLAFSSVPSSSGEFSEGVLLSAGQHLITLVVEDSYGKTDQDTLELEVYENGPPSADGVSISPAIPTTVDDLTASVQGWQDNDGADERYRYRWFVSDETGTLVEESNEITEIFPSVHTTRGDLIQVEVTPVNDYGEGTPLLSSVVEIENSRPEQPVVNILPMMAQPEDSLSCSFTPVFDADNDALDYEFSWYSNGVLLAGETLAVLDAAFTAHGDVVSCEVRAFDGYDYSVAGMSSMTILDTTPPDAPNLNSIGNYLNNPNLSIDGSCEANCSLLLTHKLRHR